jgi:telomerase reverse transcriptase
MCFIANPIQIVDFVLWSLFRTQHGMHTPSHMLCRGFQKFASNSTKGGEIAAVQGAPGLFSNTLNPYYERLKQHPWNVLPSLLGSGAERILANLLLHCGIFEPVGESNNLNQICGTPLCDLKPFKAGSIEEQNAVADAPPTISNKDPRSATSSSRRKLSDIRFARHRMLYARLHMSEKGHIRYGLPHDHVFNNVDDLEAEGQASHVLKYLFPRQFGLHNVFTSSVDKKDTAQSFMDYNNRDSEIARSLFDWKRKRQLVGEAELKPEPPIPKRLRGQASHLAARMIKKHSRCSYAAFLQHYCPNPLDARADIANSIQHATPPAQVSAFCRAAINRIFPLDFWGAGGIASPNRRVVMRNVDRFIRIRRYESLSLHDVLQDMKLHDVAWLSPSNCDTSAKMSETDFAKRKELMAELLYYLFDSFLIPLIRGHFHVTESGTRRNQLFYFRHDVWKALSEPAMFSLKQSMLEECDPRTIKDSMARRAFGVSKVRLLPKERGMRPIINLKRRIPQLKNGQTVLGRSINSILTPTFSILNYERSTNVDLLSSAMFSAEEIYPRVQAFRKSLIDQGLFGQPLFFAKVDVRACFDTIPQERLMSVVKGKGILQSDEYQIAKYGRGKLIGRYNKETPGFGSKPSWRYLTKATAGLRKPDFDAELQDEIDNGRTGSVYVDGVIQKCESRQAILDLLYEHVLANLIKLGNKYYRQKEGVPQGSIVSSLLCSYFYAELERQKLPFIHDGSSVLLRLIDDFLVISTKQQTAERFLRVMHKGVPEYGVEVKSEKSRANFDIIIDGHAITRLPAECDFPYCGNAISTVRLDLSKDMERRAKCSTLSSTLEEYSNSLT